MIDPPSMARLLLQLELELAFGVRRSAFGVRRSAFGVRRVC